MLSWITDDSGSQRCQKNFALSRSRPFRRLRRGLSGIHLLSFLVPRNKDRAQEASSKRLRVEGKQALVSSLTAVALMLLKHLLIVYPSIFSLL